MLGKKYPLRLNVNANRLRKKLPPVFRKKSLLRQNEGARIFCIYKFYFFRSLLPESASLPSLSNVYNCSSGASSYFFLLSVSHFPPSGDDNAL
jgi:hypothetical protein